MSNTNYGHGSNSGENEGALAFFHEALALEKCGNFKGAITAFSEAICLDPKNPDYYLGRGSVFIEANDYNEAIPDFNQAIDLKPDFAEAYYLRGYAYRRIGKRDKAIKDLRWVISINPDFNQAYIELDEASPRLIGKRDSHLPISEKTKYSILVVFTLGIVCIPFSRTRWLFRKDSIEDARGEFKASGCLFGIAMTLFFYIIPYAVCSFVFHAFRLLFLLCMGIINLIKRKSDPNNLKTGTDAGNT